MIKGKTRLLSDQGGRRSTDGVKLRKPGKRLTPKSELPRTAQTAEGSRAPVGVLSGQDCT